MATYFDDACEEIDAALYSGDLMLDANERAKFKEFLESWARKLAEDEKFYTEEEHAEQH